MRIFAAIVLVFVFSIVSEANQKVTVITDGAMIYQKADFDSSVISYLKAGTKISISTKRFGPFYRTRLKQGVIGYISDVDVSVSGGQTQKSFGQSDTKSLRKKSILQSVMIGLSGGIVNYAEVISRQEVREMVSVFGLKLTLPFPWLQGPFWIDTNVLFYPGAPNYYNSVSTIKPSGYLILADPSLMYHFFNFWGRDGWVYFGAGALLTYSSFLIEFNNSKQELVEARVGGTLTFGASFKLSNSFVLKGEGKYFLDKSNYYGFVGALQFAF